jgi:hypothetical protein
MRRAMPDSQVLPASRVSSKRRQLARRTLVALLRKVLASRWGIRAARIYAGILAVSITATIWVMSEKHGPDETALSLLGRAVAMLTWIAGGIATLTLAVPAKDVASAQGIAALASSRGLDDEAIARAEMAASVRILVEVIALPTVAIGVFVFAFVLGGRLQGAVWPILGAVTFGLLASVVLGAVASGCRLWGGAQGRSWLLAVVFLPWMVEELVLGGRKGGYLSIPGLLGHVWETLTAVNS